MNFFKIIKDLIFKVSIRIRQYIIKLSGLNLRQNYFLDSPIWGPKPKINRINLYSEIINFTFKSYTYPGDKYIYSFPKRYCYKLNDAIVDPRTGLIYDSSGLLIAESSAWDFQRLLSEIPKPSIRIPKQKLKGTFTFLPCIHNYYHWLIEDLPPFLNSNCVAKDAKVIVGDYDFRPIKNFIEQYIDHRFIQIDSPIRIEKLVFTAKIAGLGNPLGVANTPHPYDIKLLREYFKDHFARENEEKNKMIYLSRSRAARRSMSGELKLEQALIDIGFEVFHGDIGFFEQINLFSKAKFIIGAQGAAMSNLAWVPSQTKVIELHHTNNFVPFFYFIGAILNLRYKYLQVPETEWLDSDIDNIVSYVHEYLKI
jgi:hypothetical protein